MKRAEEIKEMPGPSLNYKDAVRHIKESFGDVEVKFDLNCFESFSYDVKDGKIVGVKVCYEKVCFVLDSKNYYLRINKYTEIPRDGQSVDYFKQFKEK